MKRVGIIGAGLIGYKRAACLQPGQLVAVADLNVARAQELAAKYSAQVETSWEDLVRRADVEIVIVATPHDALSPCVVAALKAGKHVFVEKPAGRNTADIQAQISAAERSQSVVRVGFNHRFHPAFQAAKKVIREKSMGDVMYIRARYGHGGRLGYEKEWRANPKISGGGELLDQGIHLIDLCRWLGGEMVLEWGAIKTFFWNMPVEDNGFLFLKSPDNKRSAFLHASCTEWKNLFDFEIFAKTGKVEIAGLGRSYGQEELRCYRMKPEMGPPDIEITPFPNEDHSWRLEFDAFLKELAGEKTDLATLSDALKAMTIVEQVYKSNTVGRG